MDTVALNPYQIVAPLVATCAVAYAWSLTMRGKKTVWEALLWTFFWGGVAIVAFYPGILSYLTTITGIKSQVNAILVTLIGILFFTVFYIIMRLEELEQRQARIIRAIALRDAGLTNEGKESEEDKESL